MRSLALAAALAAASSIHAQSIIGAPKKDEPPRIATITTPEKFFGFQMGADKKMAHWTDMVRYYETLAKASNRMKVVNMGKTSEGNPFLALFISSPANLAKLETLRAINARLSDPRGVPEAEIEAGIKNGKAVVLQAARWRSSSCTISSRATTTRRSAFSTTRSRS
jgi:hypothetical protein